MKKEKLTQKNAENSPSGGVVVGKRNGQTMIYDDASVGGYFVGKLHSEGGIKMVNKSTGQPLEVQGSEVIITAPAVSDTTKREFQGKMMTNRQILSKINSDGGGVSFAESGMEVPKSIKHTGASYKYGGKTMTDHEIMTSMNGGGTMLLAPNEKPSNLNAEQYKLVRTPAFKKWFGDWENEPANSSEVVDENGEPKIMYHGSRGDFNVFSNENENKLSWTEGGLGFYFTSNYNSALGYGRKVISAFINSRAIKKSNETEHAFVNENDLYKLRKSGFDSIYFNGEFTNTSGKRTFKDDELVVFEPTQIKLADGTNTKFDANNPDIRYEGGGHLAEGFSLRDIADIHQVPLAELKKQVKSGMEAESEHTSSKREQMKIVKDHLFENPKYYTLLKKAGLEHGGDFESLYENENDYIKYLVAFNLADGVESYKLKEYLKSKGLSSVGLLPENVRTDAKYRKLKSDFDIAFKRLQNLPKFKYPKNRDRVQESKDRKKAKEISDKIIQIKLKNESFENGGANEIGGTFNIKNQFDSFTTIKVMPIDENLRVSKDFFSVKITVRAKSGNDIKIQEKPLVTYPISKYDSFMEDLYKRNPTKFKKGGEVVNLVKDAKNGNSPSRDLNNYNDLLDVQVDGAVGGDSGIYVNGGAVGYDFTFLKSNPMQRARAITVLEKKIRHDGNIMSNYEFLEQLPKGLEVGVSKLFSRKSEKGYVEKLSIGDFIVDSKAEIDYYQYLQNGGYPYSKYIVEVREAETKKSEADKIVRNEQQRLREISDIENYKNSEIAKRNQIKELIEKGADAIIKKMNAPRLMQIEKYKTQRQTNDVKQDIDYHTRMIEQTERQVNNAYDIASKLYEIVDGEVQPKFDWKVGDKVKVKGYINNLPAEIETEVVELKENKFGEIAYKVESKEGIANSWISYDGLYPATETNLKKLDWDTTFTNGFNKGQKLSEQEIETIDVYNDFVYGLNFKNGGMFDAKTEQTIGLLSITNNPVKLAVILEKDVNGSDYTAITYNQKIKRRLHSLAEKSNRVIVINDSKLRTEIRQFPYLLVSENDAKNYEVASEFYEKLETPRNEFKKQFTKKMEDEKKSNENMSDNKEYEYVLTVRPFDIGTYPKENFLRFEEQNYQYGVVIYSKPLPIKEMEHYSLCPITEIKDFENKFLYYIFSGTKQKIQVKLIPDERKGYFVDIIYYDGDEVVDTEMMSAVSFLKKVQEGDYKLENEIKDEPKKDDVEITTGYFKVDSENTGFEYAKKINNYFNKWNKIKTLKDKLNFERLDVPMFGSFENENVLSQIEHFEKIGFELGANEVVRNDFKKEVKKIIDKKIFDREMDKRRYPKEEQEVGSKKEKSFESEGSTEGKGKLYEFFTPQVVADKMLALAQHYGFKGGNVLEPATGSGRLIKNLKDTNITAFEISKDNFEILKREFPNAELYNFNFEKAFLKEPRFNTLLNRKGTETWLKNAPFDLVVANPPYGKFSGLYSSYFNFKGQVEHFFILQSLHLLKKGGLGVYLIPSSFLRNGIAYNDIKKQIFEIAELVDAYRLPSNIFEKTQIGTDILILRKK